MKWLEGLRRISRHRRAATRALTKLISEWSRQHSNWALMPSNRLKVSPPWQLFKRGFRLESMGCEPLQIRQCWVNSWDFVADSESVGAMSAMAFPKNLSEIVRPDMQPGHGGFGSHENQSSLGPSSTASRGLGKVLQNNSVTLEISKAQRMQLQTNPLSSHGTLLRNYDNCCSNALEIYACPQEQAMPEICSISDAPNPEEGSSHSVYARRPRHQPMLKGLCPRDSLAGTSKATNPLLERMPVVFSPSLIRNRSLSLTEPH